MELKLAGGLDYNKVKGFKDKQKVTEDARAQFYFAVDQPFRQWLQAIDPEQDDPDEAALRWQAQARNIAEKLGKQMVMEAGNAALKGHRIVVDKGKKWSAPSCIPRQGPITVFAQIFGRSIPKQNHKGGIG